MNMPRIDFADLAPELQRKLREQARVQNVKLPRQRKTMQLEQVRQRALRVLGDLSDLTQRERARVLRHALRVNEV